MFILFKTFIRILGYSFSISVLIAATGCQPSGRTWDVRDFGAVPDSLTVNTSAIQAAIDACAGSGGGTVLIDQGTYVTGTIILKDNVNLMVSGSAELLGSSNPLDYQNLYPSRDSRGQIRGNCLIGAVDAAHISISGKGIIDGRGENYRNGHARKILEDAGIGDAEIDTHLANRPLLVRFVRSSDIRVQDIHLRQPAVWTMHLFQCRNIMIDGIDIHSHAHKNNDGIDIDSSQDGVIQNCTIDSGDDAICFKTTSPLPTRNITVNNCRLKSDWGAIKFGTESMGDFQDITVRNCLIHDTRGGGIKILSVDGARISKIMIDSIEMENVDMPVFIRLGARLRSYRDAPPKDVGSIRDVTISNVVARSRSLDESKVSPPAGIFITGIPGHRIGRIRLENFRIELPGGGTRAHAGIIVPEDETRYPEFTYFGILPASVMYARHVDTLTLSHVDMVLLAEDEREKIKFIDVGEIQD
jgi:hypothetical protein